jgi:hypothetical protein
MICRDDNETLRKLVNKLHLQNSELSSLNLSLNHAKLQIQAFAARELKFRSERDQLQFSLAVAEQDKLLLEVIFKFIILFFLF